MAGLLEVITGSMFSGKSEELIRRAKRAKFAKREIVVFKHSIDNRYSNEEVVSHNKNSISAYPVSSVAEMSEILKDKVYVEIVAIDEAQFFGQEIVTFIDSLVDKNIRVIVAGLDLDFKGEPFLPMPTLMAKADKVDKLKAICTISGEPAWCSQRLINGEPAFYDDPLVVVGAKESYEARSRRYHIVRYRDKLPINIEVVISTSSQIGLDKVKEKFSDKQIYMVDINNPLDFIIQIEKKVFEEKYENKVSNKVFFINNQLLYKINKDVNILKLLSQYSKYLSVTLMGNKNIDLIEELLRINKIDNITVVRG